MCKSEQRRKGEKKKNHNAVFKCLFIVLYYIRFLSGVIINCCAQTTHTLYSIYSKPDRKQKKSLGYMKLLENK